MPTLREVQAALAAHVLGGGFAPAHWFTQSGALPGAAGIGIYRNNYRIGLADALRAFFPVIERLVGAEFFAQTAQAFIVRHPLSCGDLNRYGAEFPRFLESLPQAAALPYLADVARLEWAYHECLQAPDAPALSPTELARRGGTAAAQRGLELHPAHRILASIYPVLRIWHSNQADARGDETVDLTEGAQTVLLLRPRHEVLLLALAPGERAWLHGLSLGLGLADALHRASLEDPRFDLAAAFARLAPAGLFVGWNDFVCNLE